MRFTKSFRRRLSVALALLVWWTSWAAQARIKLTTLPKRERVEIQLDNGTYTLVEEVRIIPLLQSTPARGNNKIDFSWTNTHVHKETILFRPIAVRGDKGFRPIEQVKLADGQTVPEIQVLNVSYPPGENALVWEVYAHKACAAKVRVTYLISNLTRSFSYRAQANKDETELTLRQYIRITNRSGEDFGWANFWIGFGKTYLKQVEQQTTIKILSQQFKKVPVHKSYTFDWYKYGQLNSAQPHASRVLMHYVLTNDKQHGLGLFPLQPGKVRLFIQDNQGSEAFLGEDIARLTPIDGKMKLYIGQARDIVCKRFIETNKRHHIRGNLYNQELVIRYEIENFKDKAATLQIVEQMQRLAQQYFGHTRGDVEWTLLSQTSGFSQIKGKGSNTPTLFVKLPARTKGKGKVKKQIVRFHIKLKNLW